MKRIGQRLVEVMFASLGILALAPLLAMIALFTALRVGWPVLASETRVHADGKQRTLLAFRTDTTAIPSIGPILRRTKLGTLPRCWNLLLGDCDFKDFVS
jgi:lipopolysaccharide/colanic/teichoic acid biosynthesis glycosyltransferase